MMPLGSETAICFVSLARRRRPFATSEAAVVAFTRGAKRCTLFIDMRSTAVPGTGTGMDPCMLHAWQAEAETCSVRHTRVRVQATQVGIPTIYPLKLDCANTLWRGYLRNVTNMRVAVCDTRVTNRRPHHTLGVLDPRRPHSIVICQYSALVIFSLRTASGGMRARGSKSADLTIFAVSQAGSPRACTACTKID